MASVVLSFVIPIYNEEGNITPIYERITEVMRTGPPRYSASYEIILVDDGSTDESFARCTELARHDARVLAIQLRRNFGKTAALHAGLRFARGSRIVTIDADMQEDPGDVFALLAPLDADYDAVSAWRKRRQDPLPKILLSRIFNTVLALITHTPLHDFNCGFKAYTRAAAHSLRSQLYGDLHRFIPLLLKQQGFRITEVVVKHRPRRTGKSKFGSRRILDGYLDFMQVLFLTSFLHRPLRLFGFVGTSAFLLGLFICIHLSWLWILGEGIGHRPLLTLGVLLLVSGIQLTSIGLIGEMIQRANFRAADEYSIRKIVAQGSKDEEPLDGQSADLCIRYL